MSRWILVLLAVLGLCAVQPSSSIYAQSGAGFTEVTNQAGLEIWLTNDIGGWHGTFIVDFDNDGFEDMFTTSHGIEQLDDTGYNALFRNNGDGTFTNVGFSAGLDGGLHGRFTRELHGASWFDYDLDGDFDVYFPNTDSLPGDGYNGFDRIYRNNGNGTFTDVSSALGLEQNNYSRRGSVVADIDLDGDLDILYVNAAVYDANRNKFPDDPYRTVYVNRLNENGTFTLEQRGIDYVEWSEGITSLDYDNDGDVDILVANEDSNLGRLVLWANDGSGNFSDVTASVGLDLDDGLHGSVTTGDVDNDGDIDVYTTDGLYRNDVAEFGTFTFLGSIAGVHEDMHLSDLDNDGDLDLVSGGVYWNDGNGSFTRDDLGVVSSDARGGMGIDYDNDGDLDLVFNEDDRTKPYLNFFRNDLSNGNHWLRVALVDPNGAIGSPGAKISVYEAGTSNLLGYREVTTATGFVSGPSPTQHFGLGSHTAVDVVVAFLDGTTLTVNDPGIDGTLTVDGTDDDTIAPVLSNVQAANVGASTATIQWSTNELGSSQVEYGPTTALGTFTTPDGIVRTSHSVQLQGLAAATTYYYRAISTDPAGNSASSGVLSFTTSAGGPAVQTLNPSADTYVKQNDGSSHGSEDRVPVKWHGSATRYGYLKFDLASVTEPVTEATLRLNVFTNLSAWPNAATVELREFSDSSWNESINWNNRPSDSAMGATLGAVNAPVDPATWWEIDVTDYVESARQAGSSQVSFTVRSTTYTNGGIELWSRESSDQPELVVESFQDTSPPAAPTGLGATSVSTSEIDLDWVSNGEPDLAGYDVYRSTTSGFTPDPGNLVAGGVSASQYADSGLAASTTYYYKVTAVDTSGNVSAASNEASAATQDPDTTPPAAPSGLAATAVSTSAIDLEWADNSEPDFAGYNVYRSQLAGFQTDPSNRIASDVSASQYGDGSLAASTTYYYKVTALDTSGNESDASAEASATTDDPDTTPPAAPSSLSATAVSSSQVSLDWADNGEGDLASYNVYRSTQAGFTAGVGNQIASGVGTSDFNDNGLTASTTYYYRVTAVDTSGNESVPSAETNATTDDAPVSQSFTFNPSADTYVKQNDGSSHGTENRVPVKWNGSSTRYGYIKFDISSVTEPITDATLRLNVFTNVSAWGSSTTVEVREFTDSSWDESINWNNRPSDAAMGAALDSIQAPVDPPVWWEIDVTDYVEARRQAGATEVSFTLRSTTSTNGGIEVNSRESSDKPELLVESFNDSVPPAPPTGLSASTVSTTQIDLDWADNGEPDLAGYDVYRSTTMGFTPSAGNRIASGLGSSQYNDAGLAASTTYYYRVTAVDSSGNESAASAEASATTDDPDTTPPAAPTGLTATAVSSSQIDLDWADNGEPDLAGYDVHRSTQAGFTPDSGNRIAADVAVSSFSDTGLDPETTYHYAVVAVDTSGNVSPASSEASDTTEQAAAPSTEILNPVADTYVKKDDTSSHGAEDRLLAKLTSGSSTRHSYLKFDTSSISGSVSQVILRLNVFTQVESWPNSVTVQAREFSDSGWAESINWNNRPPDTALGSVLGSIQAPVDPPTWWEVDVTAYVAAERAAGRNVISFAVRSANSSNGGIEIWSRESSTPPELVIDVN